jgi:hypothetical protein
VPGYRFKDREAVAIFRSSENIFQLAVSVVEMEKSCGCK